MGSDDDGREHSIGVVKSLAKETASLHPACAVGRGLFLVPDLCLEFFLESEVRNP